MTSTTPPKMAATEYAPSAQHEETPVSDENVLAFPASFAQGRFWFLQELAPGSTAYHIDTALRITGAFDITAFEAAGVALTVRHETLRTTFIQQGSEPEQLIHPALPVVPLEVMDAAMVVAERRDAHIQKVLADIGRRPFDLRTGPLIRFIVVRFAGDDHLLVVSMHHIISDGWSLGILLRELSALYTAATRLTLSERNPDAVIAEARLEPLPIQYADYAHWQREWLSGEELERQESYWRRQLGGPLPTLSLPTDRVRPAVQRELGAAHRFEIDEPTTRALRALCQQEGTTLFMALLAAYAVVLHRYSGDEDIIVGSPIAGRTRSETEGVIGLFVNTLALRVDLSETPTFRTLLARIRATTLDAYAHQDLPFDRVVQMLQPPRDRSRTPVFQTMFDVQNAREAGSGGAAITFGSARATRVSVPTSTAKFDVHFSVSESDRALRCLLLYNTDLFDAATIARIAGHFQTLLADVVRNPGRPIGELCMLSGAEREQLIQWSGGVTSYPRDATVPACFAEWVAQTPHAAAVALGKQTLTYHELDRLSDRIAEQLRTMGVQAGQWVGLCLERAVEMPAALLGVLKAGAGYLPLDPEYPAERLAFMLADTRAAVVVAHEHLAPALTRAFAANEDLAPRPSLVYLDAHGTLTAAHATTAIEPGRHDVTATSAAYVMYTSGSTGKPKGVVVPHRAIVRLVRNTNYLQLGPSEVILGFAPISFDASTLEIWGALLNGGCLALCPPGRLSPADIASVVERHRVTTAWLTAALFNQVVDGGLQAWRAVRQLLAGGEVLSVPHVRKALTELPNTRIINGYGPTENTTFTACYTIPSHWPADRSIPIGSPIANTTAYVIDAHGQLAPIGVPGELYAGGDGLAIEYLHRPDLTAERFVTRAFGTRGDERLYRTGDIVRWNNTGVIEYLGRSDTQVKLRGFRIELGEIEAALLTHPQVRECAVVLRKNARGEPMLVAYYVPAPDPEGPRQGSRPRVPSSTLRAHLRQTLPEYMVPAAFVVLDTLPLTPSGKLDRKALPAPEAFEDPSERAIVRPRTTFEYELLFVWEQLLGKRPISIHDDFFEIGGHSLLAVQMLAEIERLRGHRIPLATLFEGATIYKLAAILESAVHQHGEPGLVVLQPEGTQRPFIFLHGDVRGGGWYCRRLSQLIGPDVPFIILPTLHAETPGRPITIEAMAAIHVRELRKVQPTGPYRLGGFCVGGLLAFEIARQLAALGETVERVIVVDTGATNTKFRWLESMIDVMTEGSEEDRLEQRGTFLLRLNYYASRMRRVRRLNRVDQMRWLAANVKRHLPRPSQNTRSGEERNSVAAEVQGDPEVIGSAAHPVPPPDFVARPATNILKFQSRAGSAYMPRAYDGAVDAIWATQQFSVDIPDPTRGWKNVAREVRLHPLPSAHIGLITYNLPMLATVIRRCLGLNDA